MRRALGRGLTQLLADVPSTTANGGPPPTEISIDSIQPSERQPRTRFDDASLQELADSIRDVGILQPLLVRQVAVGSFELIAGERRLRAAKLAGLQFVPIIVRAADHEVSLELALIENLQREDITPLECAKAYRRLLDEFGLTQDDVAAKVGKSRSAVANTLRLLRLPERIIEGLESGAITEGHARALLAIANEAEQLALFEQVVERGLTVRDLEDATRKQGQPKKASGPRKRAPEQALDTESERIRQSLAEAIGLPVKLQRTGSGGRIVIEFYSDEDLSRVMDAFAVRV
jgi:ParB family chromosome partitioning protein